MKLGVSTKVENGKLVTRKLSPIPFLLAGLAFLLYGLKFPIASWFDYVKVIVVTVVVYAVCRGIWRDERTEEELPPDTGDQACNQLIQEARDTLAQIRSSNERIADPTVSRCIEEIDGTCGEILKRLEEQPALQGQLRTFLRYYLPTTNKLLAARADLDGLDVTNAAAVRDRTDRVLPEIQSAFTRQLEAIDKHRFLDLQVEMDVLEGMLKSDGAPTSVR